MKNTATLLNTSIELQREMDDNDQPYFKLIIGADPETRVTITDRSLEILLNDLPNCLSTVINSQVLIETHKARRNGHHESTRIRNQ